MLENTQNIIKSTEDSEIETNVMLDMELLALFQKSGQQYFDELTKYLCEKTNVKYAFVALYDENSNSGTALSFYTNNDYIKDFKYKLKNTPCEIVINNELTIYPEKVQELFPKDEYALQFSIESYIGLPLYDLTNKPVGIVVLMDNVPMLQHNEYKKTLLSLIESKTELELERIVVIENQSITNKEFQGILNNFQDVFVIIDYNNKTEQVGIMMSPSVQNIIGYSIDELKQIDFTDLYVNPDDRTLFFEIIKKNKKVKNYQLSFRKKNGEIVHAEMDCQLVENKSKKGVAFSLRGVLRDITKRHKEARRTEIAYLIAQKSQRRLFNLNRLGEFVFELLKKTLDVSNFYIVKLTEDKSQLEFLYFKDETNPLYEDNFFRHFNKNGFTEYIINRKSIIHQGTDQLLQTINDNSLEVHGDIPTYLLGIPLKSDGLSIGAMVIQSYKTGNTFEQEDVELLSFIASQIIITIDRNLWLDKIIQNEKHFRSLVENSSEIIGILNEKGIINYISESLKNILGYSPTELIGNNVSDYIDLDNVEELLKDILNNTKSNSVGLLKVYNKNGDKKYLEINLNKRTNDELVFNAKDVTSRVLSDKKREKIQLKLEERQEDLTNIFNYATEGIVKINGDGKFLFVNKRLCEMLGYSEKELLSKGFKNITFEGDLNQNIKLFKKIQKEKIEHVQLDKKYAHKNGKIIDCAITARWIFSKDKKSNYSIVFISDKTEEREALKKVTDLTAALNYSAAVFFTNTTGKILDLNKGLEALTGYSRKEIKGNTPDLFSSNYHPAEHWEKLWNTLKSGNSWKGEIRNRKKDGSLYWVFETITPILSSNGIVEKYISIQFDITEEKQAKTNIIKEVIEAQEQERERFAMEIHDGLGQVLLAAKMNLSALQDSSEGLDNESQNILDNSIGLMNDAVQEARTISHGLMSRVLSKFGLAYAVGEIINNINSHSNLEFTFNHNIEDYRFDEEIEMGIYRTLQELIKNIIKHSQATKAKLSIINKDNNLLIEIKDNGIGIEMGTINNNKNTGIGLRNMRSRIEYLGGVLKIDDKIKKGTKIKISISL